MPLWVALRRSVRSLVRQSLDLVLPPVCPGCGAAGSGLCQACDQALERIGPGGCPRCGAVTMVAGQPCGADHRDLTRISALVALCAYRGVGGALVRRFKLDSDLGAGRFLARAMANGLRERRAVLGGLRRCVLASVPLHAARRRVRGFDQAAWLAREIATRLGLRVAEGALERLRPTLPQGDPRVLSRANNVAGAFVVRRTAAIENRSVVLVDDVFTSGATARECAALLRQAGATQVVVLVACRA